MLVTKILALYEAYASRRRTERELSRLSDHGLRDIGVKRSQIASVAREANLSR